MSFSPAIFHLECLAVCATEFMGKGLDAIKSIDHLNSPAKILLLHPNIRHLRLCDGASRKCEKSTFHFSDLEHKRGVQFRANYSISQSNNPYS